MMESNPKINGSEWLIPDEFFRADHLRGQHRRQLSTEVNKVANIVGEDGFRIRASHLDLLYGLTAKSLIDNELIDPGKTRTTYDTGEERTVTEIVWKINSAKEDAFKYLGIVDPEDWGGSFDDREEAIQWLTNTADFFEKHLIENIEYKETING